MITRLNRSLFKVHPKPVRIEARDTSEATIYIYDEIGWFGVIAVDFAKELAGIKASTIHVRINSPGGSVMDGMAIYNLLKTKNAKIITHIDGIAASISSVIAMAGDEVIAGEGTYLMIHPPWSIIGGTAEDLRKEADVLDKVFGQISGIYQSKTGMSAEDVEAMMRAETWLTGDEAMAKKLVSRVEKYDMAQEDRTLFDLSVFANTPEALLKSMPMASVAEPAAKQPGREPDPEPTKPNTQPAPAVRDRVAELLIKAEKLKSQQENHKK